MEKKPTKKYTSKADALVKLQRYCAYQDRCHQEVRSKLIELGCYGHDLEEVMASLIEEKFLDEERFARSFARGKFRMKQWGRARIVQELKLRKISDYCIRKAMEEISEQDYQKTLKEVLEKRATQIAEGDEFARKGKLAQYAMSRGFEGELVWQLLSVDG
ncbi:MAG: RecX family transcriptional regulator [Saprospiraceae bacterium]|jgi:regulatory protein|nr:RecX family transcriptional regulator [Saprospiraceae bacterium]